jgi:hypothetical protein
MADISKEWKDKRFILNKGKLLSDYLAESHPQSPPVEA